MILHVIVHRSKEGGYWAEVPALNSCLTQADTMEELRGQQLGSDGSLS